MDLPKLKLPQESETKWYWFSTVKKWILLLIKSLMNIKLSMFQKAILLFWFYVPRISININMISFLFTSVPHASSIWAVLENSWSCRAACPGLCPVGFWSSLKMETPKLLWATASSVQKSMNKIFLLSNVFPVFQFIPIDSCPATGHYWEESASVLFIPPQQEFRYFDKNYPKPAFLQAGDLRVTAFLMDDLIPHLHLLACFLFMAKFQRILFYPCRFPSAIFLASYLFHAGRDHSCSWIDWMEKYHFPSKNY